LSTHSWLIRPTQAISLEKLFDDFRLQQPFLFVQRRKILHSFYRQLQLRNADVSFNSTQYIIDGGPILKQFQRTAKIIQRISSSDMSPTTLLRFSSVDKKSCFRTA
jgi:hypothetical protein